jgi:predicted phage replisome organizer
MSKKFYWLKIGEHFFESDQILYLESIENGEKYINFWLKLLLKCLKDKDDGEYGSLRFSDKMPYDDKLLSKILRTDIDTIRVGMKYFQELGMIEILDDKTIYIESVNKMVGKESESADRVRKFRERKRQALLGNGCNGNGNDSKEIDVDIDINKDIDKKEKPVKHKYGEYKHVLLSDEDYQKLISLYTKYGADERIKNLDEYLETTPKKSYSNHCLVIQRWEKKNAKNSNAKNFKGSEGEARDSGEPTKLSNTSTEIKIGGGDK